MSHMDRALDDIITEDKDNTLQPSDSEGGAHDAEKGGKREEGKNGKKGKKGEKGKGGKKGNGKKGGKHGNGKGKGVRHNDQERGGKGKHAGDRDGEDGPGYQLKKGPGRAATAPTSGEFVFNEELGFVRVVQQRKPADDNQHQDPPEQPQNSTPNTPDWVQTVRDRKKQKRKEKRGQAQH
jgi:hypothetical protein